MVNGVTEGFSKNLELVGVGYRASKSGDKIVLNVGYSHPVEITPEPGIEFDVPANTKITVRGIDKERVGAYALRFVPYVSLSHTKVKVLNTKVNALSVRKVKLVRRNKLADRGFTWWITYFFSTTRCV